jgi:hypothetical protein
LDERSPNVVPGPGEYSIDRGLGGLQSTLHSRTPDLNVSTTPGPGSYDPSNPRKSPGPSYTFHGRSHPQGDVNVAPYCQLPTNIGEGPKISFSSRHRELPKDQVPGPTEYSPDYMRGKRKAPVSTIHSRLDERSPNVVPGPGEYSIDRGLGGLQSTLHSRTPDLNVSTTPGPGSYDPSNPRKGPGPSYTLHGRSDPQSEVNLAPYRQLPTNIGDGPIISFSGRHPELKDIPTPAPDAYFPDYKKAKNVPLAPERAGEYSPDYGTIGPSAPQLTIHTRPKDSRLEHTVQYLKLPSTLGGPP